LHGFGFFVYQFWIPLVFLEVWPDSKLEISLTKEQMCTWLEHLPFSLYSEMARICVLLYVTCVRSLLMGFFCFLNTPPFFCSICCNLSLGLVTKARACKGAGQEWSPGVTFHAFGSIGKCEGMNPHTPKWVPILGIGLQMDFRIYRGRLQGSKLIALKIFLHHWKALRKLMS
jgi:hypothetical protein